MILTKCLPLIWLSLLTVCAGRPLYPLPGKGPKGVQLPLQTSRPYNIAHRGSNGEIPEETAAAYLRAIEEGTDFIETDILSSKDGVLICFHDCILDETTDVASHKEFADRKRTYDVQGFNITGFFTFDFTLKELKKLRTKQRYTYRDQQYNGKYPIITFEEFLTIARDAPRVVGIYPEIKNPVLMNQHVKWPGGKRFEDKVVETLKKYGYGGSYLSKKWLKKPLFIQSFAPTSLVYISNLTDSPKVLLIDDVTMPTQDTNQMICWSSQMGENVQLKAFYKCSLVLQIFSGLNISLEKSTLYMAGVVERDKEAILHTFPFESGALPVRYLGLPLLTKRMTVSDYTPLIEKICNRIGSWTARHLSFAGRLQLISSVLHSLTNFWISAFRLPSECTKEIDKLCSAFLWSGPDLNPKKAKVAWSEVCKPKEEGGLGLRSLKEANKVSCLKLIWRILSSNSLWVQWIQLYLIKKGTFWSIKETSSLGSWMWKKLLKYRELAAGFVQKEVKNGKDTSFWYDIWSPLGRLIDIAGPRGCIDMGIRLQSSVAEAIVTHRRRRHRITYLNQMEVVLDEIRQKGLVEETDVVSWKGKGDCFKPKFSTRETWDIVRNVLPKKEWYEGIWFSHATPKYSLLAWLAIRNRLTTGDRMLQWNNGGTSSCIFCHDPMESRDHLFFACQYSKEVWTGLTRKLLARRFTTRWDTVLTTLTNKALGKDCLFLVRYTFQLTVHTIWRERNQRRHGETPTTSSRMIQTLDKQVRNRISSIREMGDRRYDHCMEAWFASR